jgi:hypothetical protein
VSEDFPKFIIGLDEESTHPIDESYSDILVFGRSLQQALKELDLIIAEETYGRMVECSFKFREVTTLDNPSVYNFVYDLVDCPSIDHEVMVRDVKGFLAVVAERFSTRVACQIAISVVVPKR